MRIMRSSAYAYFNAQCMNILYAFAHHMRIIFAHAHVRILCARTLRLRFCRLKARRLRSCSHSHIGGRRKLPQAEEVRRPLGGARRVVARWVRLARGVLG